MNPMPEYSKNTTLNGNHELNKGQGAPESEMSLVHSDDIFSVSVPEQTEPIEIGAEPLSFDASEQAEHTTATTPQKTGVPLRQQLLKTVLPVTLIPLAVSGIAASFLTYRDSLAKGEAAIKARSINNASLVSEALGTKVRTIRTLTVNPLILQAATQASSSSVAQELSRTPISQAEKQYAAAKALSINPVLNDYLAESAKELGFSEIFFTSNQGFNIAYSNMPGDFVQSDERWWKLAQAGDLFISNPEVDESAGLDAAIEVNLALTNVNGDFVGVLKSVFDSKSFETALVQRMKQLQAELGADGTNTYQLLDSENKPFQTITQEGAQASGTLMGGEVLLSKLEAFRRTLSADNSTEVQQVEMSVGGKRYMISSIPGSTWVGVLSVEEGSLTAASRQLSLIFFILTPVLAGVAIAAVLYLSRQLSQPLGELAEAATQVAEGNLDLQAEVKGTQESQTLAQTFNNLVSRVKTLLVEQEKATQEQLAAQAEIAAQQMKAAQEQLAAKEFLQNRALELLMEVSPLRQGDLTIRANVTEDEIGTIADSYNATILSLRNLVSQVQTAAKQVATTADQSEGSVQELSTDALQQAEAIQAALARITEMTQAIQTVTQSAKSAEQVMQATSQTVQQGDQAMNKTVEGILAIRETVAETAKKVKQLGESSQKISKVVNLISSFADQTNLLALNASIEAARAGEEGRGFAVVADEVRSLARQSAKATSEIEALVAEIQTETNEVVTAMETGTQQVVTGTQLVEETRRSLNQITEASEQITALVQAIAKAATQQSEASQVVSATMSDVAGIATNTSGRAGQVLTAFQDLLNVAQDLQGTVGQFKLQ